MGRCSKGFHSFRVEIWADYKASGEMVQLGTRRRGKCGRKSRLEAELTKQYREILLEYARSWVRVTFRLLREELKKRGFTLGLATVQNHLKLLKTRKVNLRIKPSLTEEQKMQASTSISIEKKEDAL